MATSTVRGGFLFAVAIHAPSHGKRGFAPQVVALGHRSVAGLAFGAGVKVRLVAEDNETRNLIDSYPGDRPFLLRVGFQFFNGRTASANRTVAGHALWGLRQSHRVTRRRHLVAVLAFQAQSEVQFMAVRDGLDGRLRMGRCGGR